MANLTTGKPNLENPSSYDVKNARLESRIQEEKEFYEKKIEELQNKIKKKEEEKSELDMNIREINKISGNNDFMPIFLNLKKIWQLSISINSI